MTGSGESSAKKRPDINWVIREGNPKDVEGILECRKRTFAGEDLEKQEFQYWQYEFVDNYAGPARYFVAVDAGHVVGHYAIIPQNFIFNGERHAGSIVVDVMTDPDYRYQGMFTALGRYALAFAAEKTNLEFATGYPIRPEVLPGHLKTGWKVKFHLNTWVMPLSVGGILKNKFPVIAKIPGLSSLMGILGTFIFRSLSALQLGRNNKYRIERLTSCDISRFNPFWERFKKSAPKDCMVQERPSEYLSWRYDSNPSRDYMYHIAVNGDNDIVGFFVTRIALLMHVPAMILVDALFLPEGGRDVVRALIKNVREAALEHKCPMCAIMVNQPNPIFPSPWWFGFMPTPYKFKLITRELTEKSVVNNPELKWHLMWGDTDDI